ncbi:hypothetical protein ACO0LL_26345 [Undibacterium sp. TC4M20W]|uniref:hypothetical protein n=1 Tax=Undibacterium sp. TC4M20W TaxID=3413052 RepID=UPI003BF19D1D
MLYNPDEDDSEFAEQYKSLKLDDDASSLYMLSDPRFNSGMLPAYTEAQRDFGYRLPVSDGSVVIPVAPPERGAIDDDTELAKSNFLRSEKAGYQTGAFDGRDMSRAGDTMTALFKKNYGYTPSAGELIQYASLNGLRNAHQLNVNRVINSPSLDRLHQVEVNSDQLKDYLARNDYFVQKRREAAQNDPLTNGYLWKASQAEKNADPYYQMTMAAADRRPSLENAARLGLYTDARLSQVSNSSLAGDERSHANENLATPGNLSRRFAKGVGNGLLDTVWQPVANTIDLEQVALGLASGDRYEPKWLSSIGKNYEAGMGKGEVALRSVTGIPVMGQVLGTGLTSYDMAGAALDGRWGDVAENAGSVAAGFATNKAIQRKFAPEAGAELGFYKVRPELETTDPMVSPGRLLESLPSNQTPNFTSAEPVYVGGKTLYRVSDNVRTSPVGAYWATEPPPTSLGKWRNKYAILNEWGNDGTVEGSWTPKGGWAWGGEAAPQAITGHHTERAILGSKFRYGWLQPGGGYQIYVPDSRKVIPFSEISTKPTPWSK